MQEPVLNRNFIRTIVGGLIASIVEWYDFTIFIFLAPILSRLFFPHANPYLSTIQVYGVFALGYLTRPFGAMFLGHFGDRIGRRNTLIISILMMMLATVLTGLLPTYLQVGIWAPIGLISLRIIQGISTAGETVGAMILTFESAPTKYRGMAATSIWIGSGAGIVIASLLTSFLTNYLSVDTMMRWGWRIPFLLGFLTGFFGYFIRRHTEDSVYFSAMVKRGESFRFPVIELFKKYKALLLKILLIMIPYEINFYIFFIFLPTYSADFIGYEFSKALLINSITMSYIFVLGPIFAYFSDRIGRKPFLYFALFSVLILSVILFNLIATGMLVNFFIAQSIFAVIHSIYSAAVFSTALETVPTRIRYSVLAVAYNLGYAIFGGTAPLVATYLIYQARSLIVPAFYMMLGAAIALLAILQMRETYKDVIL